MKICKICNSPSDVIFKKLVLNKYDISYHQCSSCDYIQTEDPFWLDEAYQSAISALDVGIVKRNLDLAKIAVSILKSLGCKPNENGIYFQDYGGGVGLFTRIMRDWGYNFYRSDKYATNIFANYFDVKDIEIQKFKLTTAFEVFEHLPNPKDVIESILADSEFLLISTELQPSSNIENWWYLVPETGQHIGFFSKKTFERLAKDMNLFCTTNDVNLIILSKQPTQISFFSKRNLLNSIFNRFFPEKKAMGLIEVDFQNVLQKMNKKHV
jgi:hypothetical protein